MSSCTTSSHTSHRSTTDNTRTKPRGAVPKRLHRTCNPVCNGLCVWLTEGVAARHGDAVIAALVRIDQDKLEDWLLSTVADPSIGGSLEEPPEALRAAARPVAYGKRQIKGLTKAEADGFAEALAE